MTGDRLTEEIKFSLDGVPLIYDYLKILKDFMEARVSFWRMEPMHDRCECDRLCCCLGEAEREYLIYLPFGGRISISVPDCRVSVLDPVTGETRESDRPSGVYCHEQPYGQDAVIHIRALPPRAD